MINIVLGMDLLVILSIFYLSPLNISGVVLLNDTELSVSNTLAQYKMYILYLLK